MNSIKDEIYAERVNADCESIKELGAKFQTVIIMKQRDFYLLFVFQVEGSKK